MKHFWVLLGIIGYFVGHTQPLPAKGLSDGAAATLKLQSASDKSGVVFTFSTPQAPLAAFMRHGYFWLVVPPGTPLQVSLNHWPQGFGKPLFLKTPDGTTVRVKAPEDTFPVLSKDTQGNAQISLNTRAQKVPFPLQRLTAATLKVDPQGKAAILETPAGFLIPVQDPLTKQKLFILPLTEAGAGFSSSIQKLDFALLPTLQGVLLEVSSQIEVKLEGGAVRISKIGGLRLSDASDTKFAKKRSFDLTKALLVSRRASPAELQKSLTQSHGLKRQALQWALVNQQINNEQGVEAVATLDLLELRNPSLQNLQAFRALKGVALFLKNRLPQAFALLSDPLLGPEAAPWVAATRIKNGQAQEGVGAMENHLRLVDGLPPTLRAALLLVACQGAVHAGQERLALHFLRALPATALTPSQDKEAKGLRQQIIFEAATSSDAPLSPTPAHVDITKVNSLLQRGMIAQAQVEAILEAYTGGQASASATLQKLGTISWDCRGTPCELEVLTAMASLYDHENLFVKGLTAYKRALSLLKDKPEAAEMRDKAFALYRRAMRSPTWPFFRKFALFKKFPQFLPQGKAQAKTLDLIAQELIRHDMPDQATAFLKNHPALMQHPRLILRLAQAYILDNNPTQALALLAKHEASLPEVLKPRANALKATALTEQGNYDAALALIPKDGQSFHQMTQASLFWKKQMWAEASNVLGKIVSAQKKPEKALVERLAVALFLSKDFSKLNTLLASENAKKSPFLKALAETLNYQNPQTLAEVKSMLRAMKSLPSDIALLQS